MKKFVKVCPNCGSTNIALYGASSGLHEFCKDCLIGKDRRFFGGVFPEVEISELEKFRSEIKKTRKNQ